MSGNVWEWTEDCWNKTYAGAPTDGSAWTTGECSVGRVLRGGSKGIDPQFARSAVRGRLVASARLNSYGFRPARILP
jgi:formylglycine-generating enzyme required for sulfatase activity